MGSHTEIEFATNAIIWRLSSTDPKRLLLQNKMQLSIVLAKYLL